MLFDVAATRAQVTPCSIDPNLCFYGSNGRYYWSPSGHYRPSGMVAPSDGTNVRPTVAEKKKKPDRGSQDGR